MGSGSCSEGPTFGVLFGFVFCLYFLHGTVVVHEYKWLGIFRVRIALRSFVSRAEVALGMIRSASERTSICVPLGRTQEV